MSTKQIAHGVATRGSRAGAHHGHAAWRLLASAGTGAVVLAACVAAGATWPVAVCLGWIGVSVTFLSWIWLLGGRLTPSETARHARSEDSSLAAADALLVTACVTSLVAVGFVLVESGREHGLQRAALTALGVASVALAWLVIHAIFALRYARLYYAGRPGAGIDFHSDELPDYRDFAYVALTIGMTFQVSDTDLTTKPVRHAAVRHAMLSYVFGAVIVAITINIVGTLLSK